MGINAFTPPYKYVFLFQFPLQISFLVFYCNIYFLHSLVLAGVMVNGYLTRLSKFLESGHAKVCKLVAKVGARKNSLPQVADVVQLSPPNQCYYSVQHSSSPARLLNITHGQTGKHYN
jgi:hypothetical protein